MSILKRVMLVLALLLAGLLGTVRGGERPDRPILERETWNLTVGTSADVFTASLTVPTDSSAVRVRIYRVTLGIDATIGTTAVVYARYTCGTGANVIGGTEHASQASNLALNSATALVAGNLYTFDVPATRGASLNFRVGTQTVFRWFMVQRIEEGQ